MIATLGHKKPAVKPREGMPGYPKYHREVPFHAQPFVEYKYNKQK